MRKQTFLLSSEMVGGRLSCCFSVGLLLGVCLHNVEASDGKRVVHKLVGDSVELSADLPTEGVTAATWKYEGTSVANEDSGVTKDNPFKDRLEFNRTSFSLTLRELTVQDSGDFSFLSEAKGQQRPTVTITLIVHDPLPQDPVLTLRISQPASNGSCTVSLECRATSDSNATYSWSVGTQVYKGPKLQLNIRPQDGATNFTCRASVGARSKSASEIVTCGNNTSNGTLRAGTLGDKHLIWILGGAVGGLLIIITVVVVSVCCCKRRRAGSDSNELTVYADVADFAVEGGMNLKPCSLYDTIENRPQTVTQGPQTVYDKIQMNRMRRPSVSPYQEVS